MAASHKEQNFYQYENGSGARGGARGITITLIAFFVSLFIVFVAGLYNVFNILDFVLHVLVRILIIYWPLWLVDIYYRIR